MNTKQQNPNTEEETSGTNGSATDNELKHETPVKAVGGEMETLRVENDLLRAAIRLRDAREQITEALKTAGARSPGLLFEAAKDSLQFDDDGSLIDSAAILHVMQQKFPEQFAAETGPSSIDGGAGMLNRGNILTKEALARMTPAEIAKLDWAEVRQVLSNG